MRVLPPQPNACARIAALIAVSLAATLAAAPPEPASADGTTPLHLAVSVNDLATATALMRAGADVNAVNRLGVTPLSLAAGNGSAPILTLLLAAGARAQAADAALRDGRTMIMLAARTGSAAAVNVLVGCGGDVNATESRTGTTALMWAAAENRPAAVWALVTAGANVDARSRITAYPHTPPGVIGDPLEEGASYVGQTVLPKGGWTAMMYAARQGALDAARALAESGADLDLTDPDGTPALTFAVINGHYEIASLLADQGADVNLADRTGATPLYSAVDMHTLSSSFGRPDLPHPMVAGSVDAVRMLLGHGANPNARLNTKVLKRVYNPGDARLGEGSTPLMRAAKTGDVTMMRLLIDAGADLDAVSAAGDTALHIGVASPAAVRLLAESGATLDVRNKKDVTPLTALLGTRAPNEDTVALLRDWTGDYTTQAPAPAPTGPRRNR